MPIFVWGVNHKACPVDIREKLHFTAAKAEQALTAAGRLPEISELVVLSTCNRVELYGCTEGDVPGEALMELVEKIHGLERSRFSGYLQTRTGKDAVHHVFRVAAGLESLAVGENEILGQLREAFALAVRHGTVHAQLYRLMEKALKTGKEVRRSTGISRGAVSVPSVAVELARSIFTKLSRVKAMVVGTGEMGLLTLRNLKDAGAAIAHVVSRDPESGRRVAEDFGATWLPIESWNACLAGVDIVIASTACPQVLIRPEQVRPVAEARRDPVFFFDIAVPRNVDSRVGEIEGVYLYNIDDLKSVAAGNLQRRREDAKAAERIVERAVASFYAWLEQLKARPVIERLEAYLDRVLADELKKMGRKSEAERGETGRRIRAKLLHPAIEKIKEASLNGGAARYLEALQALFGLEEGTGNENHHTRRDTRKPTGPLSS